MSKSFNSFLRVVRSYSIEEKVVSFVLVIVMIVVLVQGVLEIFKRPELFAGEGGYYTEGLVNERSTMLNPVYTDFAEANREISGLIFSGLTKYDPGVKAFVADLAELSIGDDGKVYTFKMREDVLWHDGNPLTAEDVYFTFVDVIQSEDFQNPVLKANFEGIEVRKIDDYTVEFELDNSNSFFITNLNIGILPKHLLGGIPVADLPQAMFNLLPVGTGPYKVETQLEIMEDGRQRLLLVKNDNYYGEKSKIENIRFHIYPSSDAMNREKNTLNIISKVPKDIIEEIRNSDRFQIVSYSLPQYTAIFMNMDSAVLEKEKVRVALQKALDKEKLLTLFPGKTAVDTPLMELNQSEWLYKPNVEEANGALFDAGYKKSSDDETDQYRKNSSGENLKLVLLARDLSENVALANETDVLIKFLTDSWKQIGVEIEVQYEMVDIFAERIRNRDYDLLLTGESLGYNFDTYSFWHSSQSGENGLNLSNYRSFVADSYIEKIRGTFDVQEKNELLSKLAEAIATDAPAIFLYRPNYEFATDGKVKGISLDNLAFASDRFDGISSWCILCEQN